MPILKIHSTNEPSEDWTIEYSHNLSNLLELIVNQILTYCFFHDFLYLINLDYCSFKLELVFYLQTC